MRRIILSLLAIAVMMTACQSGGGGQEDSARQSSVAVRLSGTEAENRVRDIYAAVFKVYNEEDSMRNMDLPIAVGAYGHRGEFNAQYCSKAWNSLYREVNRIDSIYNSGALGYWEADYWIMGQDWHQLSISDIKVVSVDEKEALVEFRLHNFDAAKPVQVILVNEDGNWLIDSFIDVAAGLNWKSDMEEYVKGYTDKNK